VLVVDIEEFYDENPVRRNSEESEFGRDWTDRDGKRAEVSWVQDTGELYLMSEPVEPIIPDLLGGEHLQHLSKKELTVEVLAVLASMKAVEDALAGWHQAMSAPNSLTWLRDRVATPPQHHDRPSDPEDDPTEIPGADPR
jgi:hypothetical protein